MKDEKWLPIPNYEGYYEISDLGRVRSVERKIKVCPENRKAYVRIKRSFIIKPQISDINNIVTVKLCVDNVYHDLTIAKTVRLLFGDKSKYKKHKDGDIRNNSISNF